MWMLVGVNLSDKPVAFYVPPVKDFYVTADARWLPLEYKRKTVRGSALDFSWTADAPAGKYGFVIPSRSGNLAFEKAPEARIRFYGVNLCFDANFTDKKSVDELADTLVRNGYNAVRLHHYDSGLLDRNASDSLTFDKQRLDSLDYLFSVLKNKGIYITIDFYSVRSFKPGDNIPGAAYVEQEMKALLPVSREAMENWKGFARRLLEHPNPYTGMTWGEDPALFAINLVNEEALKYRWSATPHSRKLYRAAFDEWKKKNDVAKGDPSDSDPVFLNFLHASSRNSVWRSPPSGEPESAAVRRSRESSSRCRFPTLPGGSTPGAPPAGRGTGLRPLRPSLGSIPGRDSRTVDCWLPRRRRSSPRGSGRRFRGGFRADNRFRRRQDRRATPGSVQT